jgi:hypothetical protein
MVAQYRQTEAAFDPQNKECKTAALAGLNVQPSADMCSGQ